MDTSFCISFTGKYVDLRFEIQQTTFFLVFNKVESELEPFLEMSPPSFKIGVRQPYSHFVGGMYIVLSLGINIAATSANLLMTSIKSPNSWGVVQCNCHLGLNHLTCFLDNKSAQTEGSDENSQIVKED